MELGYGTRDDGLCCEEQEEDHEDHNISTARREAVEKEHMFEKVLTPSDVGKLNRLVIPKQQAEKHFPLDASAGEKGLLLSFEDRSGKPWPFRYSYWNSSQSYVMTKGWSRFVKEKKLDAGGTVSFARGVGDSARGRLFIDWKPRVPSSASKYPMVSFPRPGSLWEGRVLVPTAAAEYRNAISAAAASASCSGGSGRYLVYGSVVAPPPVHLQQQAAAKRVRLFGVNLDFQESENQHPYRKPAPLQPQQQEFSSSSSSPSPRRKEQQQSLDLDLE